MLISREYLLVMSINVFFFWIISIGSIARWEEISESCIQSVDLSCSTDRFSGARILWECNVLQFQFLGRGLTP